MSNSDELKCDMHGAQIKNLKEEEAELWKAIERIRDALDELRNRPPVWCTLLLSVLTFLLGCGLTYAALAVKVAGVGK